MNLKFYDYIDSFKLINEDEYRNDKNLILGNVADRTLINNKNELIFMFYTFITEKINEHANIDLLIEEVRDSGLVINGKYSVKELNIKNSDIIEILSSIKEYYQNKIYLNHQKIA